MTKNKTWLLFGILVIAGIGVIGASFALWQITLKQETTNVVTTSCLKVSITEGDAVTLTNAYPISDEAGNSSKPYTFTLKNECDERATYVINLETITTESKKLADKYVKASLLKREEKIFEDVLKDFHRNDIKVIEDASAAYMLHQGILSEKEEISFDLRLWMNEDTPTLEETMNANWQGKITITSDYLFTPRETTKMLRTVKQEDTDGMWNYKSTIKNVIIETNSSPVVNSIASYDESALKDESVKSYIVENSDGTHTAYIKSNSVLYANLDSSNLFKDFTNLQTIEGLEYLNTELTNNMSSMFNNTSSLTSVNLSNFNTNQVTAMRGMFYNSGLTTLDVSTFNTENVTDMGVMFGKLKNITELNLSNFNTANVKNMENMFRETTKLTTLDLSYFDTSNVTTMRSMFYESGITNLNISNFNTTNVEDMAYMFYFTKLTTLDLNHFNTSKVVDMNSMFEGMKNLNSLDVTNFDTSNVTDMSYMFYETSASVNGALSLNLNNWNTESVTNMYAMFYQSGFTTLNIDRWNTSKVTNMGGMFVNLPKLTTLDLTNWDTSSVTSYQAMFYFSQNLRTITYGTNFVYHNNADVSLMFSSCPASRPTHSSWSGII